MSFFFGHSEINLQTTELHQNTRQIKPEYIRTQPKIPIGRN